MSASLVVADTSGMSPKAAERHVAAVKKYEAKKDLLAESASRTASAVLAFATGLGVGYIEGRYPDKADVLGVPLPMVIAVAGLAGSIFAPADIVSYCVDIGNAGSAIYGRDVAYDLGTKKKEKSGQATATVTGIPTQQSATRAFYPRAA